MRRLLPSLALLLSLATSSVLATVPGEAHAQSAEDQAESVRLSEDMKRLSRRNAWRGVDEAYVKMLALEESGVPISHGDHVLGADAATALGDITGAYDRLKRSTKHRTTEDVAQRIAAIEEAFGVVSITVEAKFVGAHELRVTQMPFAADQRNAITKAQGQLAANRSYEGLLPYGEYIVGPKRFTLSKDGGPASITLTAEEGVQRERGMAFVGPRVDLGPAFTAAGAPGTPDGLEPGPFSGAGLRAGVGVQLGFHSGFGGLVQVGYHGMFGGTPEPSESTDSDATSLHMGYGWLAGAWRKGNLDVALGPLLSIAAAKASGIATESGTDLDLVNQTVDGSMVMAGGSVGLTYMVLDVGKLKGGIGLQAGMQSDSSRPYSWGQLGLTVAPARRDG